MSQKPDGGPAFPQQVFRHNEQMLSAGQWGVGGMTLRDWFAGQALVGIAGAMNSAERRRYRDEKSDGREVVVAYKLADAMLAEREK